jgi:hypothetical protein
MVRAFEYDETSNIKFDVDTDQQATHYVHSDHLGAPKLITDENVNVMWQA